MASDEIKKLTDAQVILLWEKAQSASRALEDIEDELEPEHSCTLCGRDTFEDHKPDCVCGTVRLLRHQVEGIQQKLEREYPEVLEEGLE